MKKLILVIGCLASLTAQEINYNKFLSKKEALEYNCTKALSRMKKGNLTKKEFIEIEKMVEKCLYESY